jgi:hypothetical protein
MTVFATAVALRCAGTVGSAPAPCRCDGRAQTAGARDRHLSGHHQRAVVQRLVLRPTARPTSQPDAPQADRTRAPRGAGEGEPAPLRAAAVRSSVTRACRAAQRVL